MVSTVLAVTADLMRIVAEASDSDEERATPWAALLFVLVPAAILGAWLLARRRGAREQPQHEAPPAETTEFLDDVNRPPGR